MIDNSSKKTNRSIRSRSFKRNLSLSSSAVLISLSKRFFLSCMLSASMSTSRGAPLSSVRSIPFLTLSYVGSFSIAAHFSASSSSSSLADRPNMLLPFDLPRHDDTLRDTLSRMLPVRLPTLPISIIFCNFKAVQLLKSQI